MPGILTVGVAGNMGREAPWPVQVYQFDVAGWVADELVPKVVADAYGASGGAPAWGTTVEVYNAVGGMWEVVGSHGAMDTDPAAARTISAALGPASDYVAGGRVYLRVRPTHPEGRNGARVRCDTVELGAVLQREGISRNVAVPAPGNIARATLSLLEKEAPTGSRMDLYLSADGGATWEAVSDGVEHVFAAVGADLRWRVVLVSQDGVTQPWVGRLKVDYLAGLFVEAGASDIVGSTSATFVLPAGAVGKVIGLRVELSTQDPTRSPVVYDLVLRYVLAPEVKREWVFNARLEGTPEVPMVRLDGTPEPDTGAQVAQALWDLRGQKGPLTFVDLDGTIYTVWFTELREEVGELSQRKGYQGVARLTLLEA